MTLCALLCTYCYCPNDVGGSGQSGRSQATAERLRRQWLPLPAALLLPMAQLMAQVGRVCVLPVISGVLSDFPAVFPAVLSFQLRNPRCPKRQAKRRRRARMRSRL